MHDLINNMVVRPADIPFLQFDSVLGQLAAPEVEALFNTSQTDQIPLEDARLRARELMAQRVA